MSTINKSKILHLRKSISQGFDIFLLIFALIVIFPYVWMFFSSFKSTNEVFTAQLQLLPTTWKWSNYTSVFTSTFLNSIKNSFIILLFGVTLDVLIAFLAGYAFAKLNFYGKSITFIVLLGSLMIPPQVLMLPSYILIGKLKWLNTFWGLIIPRLSPAFGLFLVRQFIMTVPNDIEEAACIDGANMFTRIFKIYWPICFPAVTTVGVFSLIGYWNDYYWPMMIISNKNMQTLSLTVAGYKNVEGLGNWSQQMSAAVIATIPMIILFIFARKTLIGNITADAVKG